MLVPSLAKDVTQLTAHSSETFNDGCSKIANRISVKCEACGVEGAQCKTQAQQLQQGLLSACTGVMYAQVFVSNPHVLTCTARWVDLKVCTMLGWPRSTECMASRAPRIVEEGVAEASPAPATKSGSAADCCAAGINDESLAMWIICNSVTIHQSPCGPLSKRTNIWCCETRRPFSVCKI